MRFLALETLFLFTEAEPYYAPQLLMIGALKI